jgi:hypothetical protein
MPEVLVVGATAVCDGPLQDHGGTITFSVGRSLLTVSGAAAVVKGQEAGLLVAGCKHQSKAPGPVPCTVTQQAVAGISTLLTVRSQPVLLEGATGTALNPDDPAATWKVSKPGQSLLNVSS